MDQLGKLCKNTTTKLDHGISHEDEKTEDLPLSKTLKAQRFYRRRNHVFNSLASRRASAPQSHALFFNISTSKSHPNMVRFSHFSSEQASSHRRVHFFVFNISSSKRASRHSRAHFCPHINFQKRSDFEVLLALWLGHALTHHSGLQFLISHPAKRLRTRRFSEPYFSTPRSPKTFEEHGASRFFHLFANLHLLSTDSFFSDSLFFGPFSSDSFSSDSFSSVPFSPLTVLALAAASAHKSEV